MSTPQQILDRKKLEVSIAGMKAAKAELELKILEREQEIQRLREHHEIQVRSIAQAESALQKIGD